MTGEVEVEDNGGVLEVEVSEQNSAKGLGCSFVGFAGSFGISDTKKSGRARRKTSLSDASGLTEKRIEERRKEERSLIQVRYNYLKELKK